MKIKQQLAPVAAAAFGLSFVPALAQAQSAGPVWDFYGQLNMGVVSVDDGVDSNSAFTDNDNSNSRIGLSMTQAMQNGSELKLTFETGLGLTGSSSINGTDDDFDAEYHRTELRKFDLAYKTPTMGTFSLGQGSTSTDGSAEADFSGTGVAAYVGISDIAGSQSLRFADGTLSTVNIGNTNGSFDGSRRLRVRYDTPVYSGFSASVSAGQEVLKSGDDNDYYDVGTRYATDYGDYKIDTRLGYSFRDSTNDLVMGSAAVLHAPTGLNLAVSAGRQVAGDADYAYIKAGLTRDYWAIGSTSLSIDYYDGNDFTVAGSDTSSVGVAVVQRLDEYNTELYATYRTYEFDSASASYQDMDVTFVGARWKF
ncbi:porin [Sulfitobacter marinus]|uniref:Porin n=1 Tax=Sulfitobacter marinus TaxID=394264 RepID=A0A1I6ULC5_9RHOB|nr:porin [Sulfitobacter marinus]SFT02286.1 porin [Sulfitobacter marinus]